jgi:16S rRNA (cytidine1402-2'-O)-methyltransferase
MVFFESPRRLSATLAEFAAAFGAERRAAVCRELTKTHEEVRRGTLAELAEWADAGVLGEITVVLAGAAAARASAADLDAAAEEVAAMVTGGSSRKDAVTSVAAARGLRRRALYETVIGQQ